VPPSDACGASAAPSGMITTNFIACELYSKGCCPASPEAMPEAVETRDVSTGLPSGKRPGIAYAA
jgi:hypothetical protein